MSSYIVDLEAAVEQMRNLCVEAGDVIIQRQAVAAGEEASNIEIFNTCKVVKGTDLPHPLRLQRSTSNGQSTAELSKRDLVLLAELGQIEALYDQLPGPTEDEPVQFTRLRNQLAILKKRGMMLVRLHNQKRDNHLLDKEVGKGIEAKEGDSIKVEYEVGGPGEALGVSRVD